MEQLLILVSGVSVYRIIFNTGALNIPQLGQTTLVDDDVVVNRRKFNLSVENAGAEGGGWGEFPGL
jgi:hypothetical protein